jgi:hypothetical protein
MGLPCAAFRFHSRIGRMTIIDTPSKNRGCGPSGTGSTRCLSVRHPNPRSRARHPETVPGEAAAERAHATTRPPGRRETHPGQARSKQPRIARSWYTIRFSRPTDLRRLARPALRRSRNPASIGVNPERAGFRIIFCYLAVALHAVVAGIVPEWFDGYI